MYNRETLTFLPLRGMVLFPNTGANIDVGRIKSAKALKEAKKNRQFIMVSTQKDTEVEDPQFSDIYEIGTVCKIQQFHKTSRDTVRVQIEGLYRARILDYRDDGELVEVDVEILDDMAPDNDKKTEALIRACVEKFEEWVKVSNQIPNDVFIAINVMMEDGNIVANLITTHLQAKYTDKQEIMNILDVPTRLKALYKLIKKEIDIIKLENKLVQDTNENINKQQREYFLREQIKVINSELGDAEDHYDMVAEYREELASGKYPEYVVQAMQKEIKRLLRTNSQAPDYSLTQNYIETVLEMPWSEESAQITDIVKAREILDKQHYGMEKVKERIIEYLSIKSLSPELNAPIICLVGPPGVGKTSIASSIAEALHRKFVRASLGGVRDEAELRGHRRTYVGAMPGRIIDGIKNAGTKDPVFLLDEVDKMASDYRGDPVAALLEILDPEQNKTFSDNYLSLAFDLSKVMWIITANDIQNIPRPLRDRMEIIELPSYSDVEKFHIAKEHLWDKVKLANGLKKSKVIMNDAVFYRVIELYTREAGVRELERQLSKICRRAAYKIVSEDKKSIRITVKNLEEYLGKPRYSDIKAEKAPQVGLCTGLAWTEIGGVILPVEVAVLNGKGNVSFTGQLGNVMQESGKAAVTYIRSRMEELKITDKFYEDKDIHVHFPEGAIPKDGPSAGITMSTAIVSALTGHKVRSDVAMTGEITLRGRVLPIGGLKEKSMAAYREGIYTVIMPKDNEKDLEEISPEVKEKMKFIPVDNMDDVLKYALVD